MRLEERACSVTAPFHPFSCAFNPFNDSVVACSTGSNYGLKGAGRIFLFDSSSTAGRQVDARAIDFREACFDVAWSERKQDLMLVACGDGRIYTATSGTGSVEMLKAGHTKEASGVNCSTVDSRLFLSSGWDGRVNIYSSDTMALSECFAVGKAPCHEAVFNYQKRDLVAVCSGEATVKMLDIRQRQITTIGRHEHPDVLSVDWCKYSDRILASGSADMTIRLFDISMPTTPLQVLRGHRRAARRLRWSPFSRDMIVSCGYDMTLRVWNTASLYPLVATDESYPEFVCGLDLSQRTDGLMAVGCWDSSLRTIMHFV